MPLLCLFIFLNGSQSVSHANKFCHYMEIGHCTLNGCDWSQVCKICKKRNYGEEQDRAENMKIKNKWVRNILLFLFKAKCWNKSLRSD